MYRVQFVVALVILHLISVSTTSAQSPSEVLGPVSRNVKEFQDLLPNFVCNEKVTSTEFDSGRLIKERVVESIFTGVQELNIENRFRVAFTETREVLTIDGKPARKGTPFPKLPYRFTGGFGSLLIMTFAPDNLQHHTYSIADRYGSGTSAAVLIRFATKEGQQSLRVLLQGTRLFAKDVGAAWIDQTSFQVLRLQRQSLNLPSGITRLVTTADYGPVTIGEKEFWMPKRIRAEATERNSVVVSYVAEYSDCRRFSSDIKLIP